MDARFRSRPDPSFRKRGESIWHVERSTRPGEWGHIGTVAELRCEPGVWYVALPAPPPGQNRKWFPSREEAMAYLLLRVRIEGIPEQAPAEETGIPTPPAVPEALSVESLVPGPASDRPIPLPEPLSPLAGFGMCMGARLSRVWASVLSLLGMRPAPRAID